MKYTIDYSNPNVMSRMFDLARKCPIHARITELRLLQLNAYVSGNIQDVEWMEVEIDELINELGANKHE